MRARLTPTASFLLALGLATTVSVLLLSAAVISDRSEAPVYLLWNLFLAWVPFAFALYLQSVLSHKLWSSWEALIISAAWLLFLPNSFYMVSDFIHLSDMSQDFVLFAAITFSSFIFTGLLLGISSLYIVHYEIQKRASDRITVALIGALLFICSVAIYVGRDLRWNSWDIITNPTGVLFDVSERLVHPAQYPHVLGVVVPFFLLLSTMYAVLWQTSRFLQAPQDHHYLFRNHP